MSVSRLLAAALLLTMSFLSCGNRHGHVEKAFYYWKNNGYSLSHDELMCLKNQGITKLYVKFFEVEPDAILGQVPVAKSELHIWNYSFSRDADTVFKSTMQALEIIPTVYIRNEALSGTSQGRLDTLADNIYFLLGKRYKEHIDRTRPDFKEIQLDCDWTGSTRENYFYLLRKIKAMSGKTISCTLRLYPYKYRDKMGIPPADKVVLMCYNLTNPLSDENKNSILDNRELELYLANTTKYPLHLDLALPVFSWMQVWKNNQFSGVITPKPHELDSVIKPVKPLWYEVTSDKELDNTYLRTGDKLKAEGVAANDLKETVALLNRYIPADTSLTVILFHLDKNNLTLFDNETLTGLFTGFGR